MNWILLYFNMMFFFEFLIKYFSRGDWAIFNMIQNSFVIILICPDTNMIYTNPNVWRVKNFIFINYAKITNDSTLAPSEQNPQKISSMMYMAFNVVIRSRNWSVRGKNSLGVSGLWEAIVTFPLMTKQLLKYLLFYKCHIYSVKWGVKLEFIFILFI